MHRIILIVFLGHGYIGRLEALLAAVANYRHPYVCMICMNGEENPNAMGEYKSHNHHQSRKKLCWHLMVFCQLKFHHFAMHSPFVRVYLSYGLQMRRTAGMSMSLMASAGMSLTVVRTLDIRIVLQIAVQKGGNLCICITTCATIQLDTGFRKCILRTASDTAADL